MRGRVSAIGLGGGSPVPFQLARPGGLLAVLPLVLSMILLPLLDLDGLRREFGRHQAESLGARKIEAGAGDAKTVFGLATQELGSQHDCDEGQVFFDCEQSLPNGAKCAGGLLVPAARSACGYSLTLSSDGGIPYR